MQENRQYQRDKPAWERHAQTVLLTLITALVVGAYQRLEDINEKQARMEEREVLRVGQFSELTAKMDKIQAELNSQADRLARIEASKKQ
jgi:hypothetical protein